MENLAKSGRGSRSTRRRYRITHASRIASCSSLLHVAPRPRRRNRALARGRPGHSSRTCRSTHRARVARRLAGRAAAVPGASRTCGVVRRRRRTAAWCVARSSALSAGAGLHVAAVGCRGPGASAARVFPLRDLTRLSVPRRRLSRYLALCSLDSFDSISLC